VDAPTRIHRALEWWKNSRAGRVVKWFMACNGGQLCAGIAYQTLFSIFAVLTVAWSAFSASLGRYPALKEAVLEQINGWLPGLIGYGNDALITPDQLVLGSALNWASIVAIVMGSIWIYRVMTAIHTAICRVLAVSRNHSNRVWDQITKFLGFIVLASGIVLAAITSIVTQALGGFIIAEFGAQLGTVVNIASQIVLQVVGALINALVIMGAIRLVARIWFISEHKRKELWWGALAGGLVLELLRWLGISFVTASAMNNPLLAPFAAIVTILLLANFAVYVLLMVCAWVYNPQRLDRPRQPKPKTRRERRISGRRIVHSPLHTRTDITVGGLDIGSNTAPEPPDMIWHAPVGERSTG